MMFAAPLKTIRHLRWSSQNMADMLALQVVPIRSGLRIMLRHVFVTFSDPWPPVHKPNLPDLIA
jgi:hypothetical protein